MYHYKDHIIDENRIEIQYAKKIISGEYKACPYEIMAQWEKEMTNEPIQLSFF